MLPLLNTKKAGILSPGDEFRLPGTEIGQVFVLMGIHEAGDPGGEHVSAYGGDANPKARRQWRAFPIDRVVSDARPPGRLARAKRDRKEGA